ncbi:MAG TPA: RHS repeat-associated core domain-containing protein [Panacibacter sp.]|nr:RHS repeat-associated core domain-containing protein [Panacibacter sp.]
MNYYLADIASAQDYYPFGMQMPGRVFNAASYRYGFNGKELDKDITAQDYDYGMRIYDARIGKFLSVDPLTNEYPWYTPYQFAGCKPIFAKDLDGGEDTPFDFSEADRKIREESARLFKIDPALSKQYQLRGNLIGFSVVGGAILLPYDLSTGGNVTRTVFTLYTTSQIAGAAEHNRATTSEGKAAQDLRSKTALANAIIGWGVGKIVGTAFTPWLRSTRIPFRSEIFDEGNAILQKAQNDGVRIIVAQTSDDLKYLESMGMKASYMEGTDNQPASILVTKNAGRADLLEEAIHHQQTLQYGGEYVQIPINKATLEIEAQDKLLTIGGKEGWSESEMNSIKSAKVKWENHLKELQKKK